MQAALVYKLLARAVPFVRGTLVVTVHATIHFDCAQSYRHCSTKLWVLEKLIAPRWQLPDATRARAASTQQRSATVVISICP